MSVRKKLLRVTLFAIPVSWLWLVLVLFAAYHVLASAGTRHTSGQKSPELPQIIFENFGPGIREQVKQAYEEARKKPRAAQAVGHLGMVLQTYEDHERAAPCYELARQLAPQEFRWVYLLGLAQAALGRPDAAMTLRAALQRRSDYVPAQLKLADVLLAAGAWEASERLYETALRQQPDLALAHYGLGRVKAARRDFAAALSHYRRACELSPRFGAAHYALALAYRALKQPEQAAAHLALHAEFKLVRPFVDDPVWQAVATLNAGAAARLQRGVELEAAGRLPEAIAEHEAALAIDPQFEQVRLNLITLYARTEQPAKAEEHYRALQRLNPNLAESHYNFGVALVQQQRSAEAAQAFRRAFEINPQFAEAHFNYAALLEGQKQFTEAIAHYRLAVAHKPNHRQARFQLARLLIHEGQLAEAITNLRQTLAPEDSETPRYTYALAAAYARAGDRAQALQYARAARDRAAALRQTALLVLIERDLKTLEQQR